MASDVSTTNQASTGSVLAMFIAGLVLIALFWGATELMRSWVGTGEITEAEQAAVRTKNLQELHASNEKELGGYSWVDKEKGTVRIPIERAMELEIAALSGQTPAPGTLIDPEAAAAEAAAKSAASAPVPVAAPAAAPAPVENAAPTSAPGAN